eukprot:scaffold138714_cov29-Tisochrysis_lutea.AAC.2
MHIHAHPACARVLLRANLGRCAQAACYAAVLEGRRDRIAARPDNLRLITRDRRKRLELQLGGDQKLGVLEHTHALLIILTWCVGLVEQLNEVGRRAKRAGKVVDAHGQEDGILMRERVVERVPARIRPALARECRWDVEECAYRPKPISLCLRVQGLGAKPRAAPFARLILQRRRELADHPLERRVGAVEEALADGEGEGLPAELGNIDPVLVAGLGSHVGACKQLRPTCDRHSVQPVPLRVIGPGSGAHAGEGGEARR